jgi:hypothetical protein
VVTPAPKAPPPAASTQAALRPAIPAPPAPAPKAVAPPPKPAPPPEPKAAPPRPEAKAPTGAAVVQIGAVSSPALADKAWNDAVAAAPGLAAGKGKQVTRIEGGSLYRTFVTGFASKADAQAFCARLQSAGKACFVR